MNDRYLCGCPLMRLVSLHVEVRERNRNSGNARCNVPNDQDENGVFLGREQNPKDDFSTSFQPICFKQLSTDSSWSDEQSVTVNLITILTSEPFVFTYERVDVGLTSYDMRVSCPSACLLAGYSLQLIYSQYTLRYWNLL